MLLLASFTIFLLTCIYLYLTEKFKFWEKLGVKHLKPNILLGHMLPTILNTKAVPLVIDDHYKKFKNERYFGFYQFTEPIFVVKDPDLIKQITVKDFDHFTDHQFHSNDKVDKFWAKTLFAMMGDTWRKMRSTLSPAFTGNKMRYMYPLVNNIAENMVESFKKRGTFIKLEMKDTFSKLTNDTIASTALGLNCDSINDPDNMFYTIGKKGVDFTGMKRMKFFLYSACPSLLRFFGAKVFVDEFANFFRHVINDTIKLREENNFVRHDILHLLLKARKGESIKEDEDDNVVSGGTFKEYLTNEYIAAQAAIFYFGGFDTTSYFLSFVAYNLATHPEVQEKLKREIDAALEKSNGDINYEVIQSIKYLDLVLNESLRLYSPVIFLDRICNKDYTINPINSTEKTVTIKKGSVIWIPTYSLQRDEQFYNNPNEFDPERVIGDNSQLFGFGVGPRACIGQRFALMESKTIICHLLKNFDIVTVEETQIPIQLSKNHINITSEKGIWLGLKTRD